MIPINRYGNCGQDISGTGLPSCIIASFGDVTGFNLHPTNFLLNTTTDALTATTWKNKIKSFDVRPFRDIYDFTQDTPDNERATSSRGNMSKIRDAKPLMSFLFTKGGCLHRALVDHTNGYWTVSFTFEKGILFALAEDNASLTGFDVSMFDVQTMKFQQGTDPQTSTATIQLSDADQFNRRFIFLTWAELGVNLSKIDGVIEAGINYTVAPTAATTFAVSVGSACNLDDTILGLDESTSWLLGGTQATARNITSVVYRPATKDYLFTLSGALVNGDSVQPTLISSAAAYFVAEDDLGGLYKGKAKLFTVGA